MEGSKIGRYRIVRMLGEGGMGAVYEAVLIELDRRVALKLLHAAYSRDDEMRQRFFNEARAVNAIRHPGIVDVSDFGMTEAGCCFLVMELLEGMPLRQRLEWTGYRIGLLAALRIGQQLASALAAAHKRGIIHRDLKPDNVFLVRDPLVDGGERSKLLDFGIAKLAQAGGLEPALRTRTGALMGTPVFMSPEQFEDSAHVDAKSDVYSLGVLLYQMLAGQPPFVADNLIKLMELHRGSPPPPLLSQAPDLPAECVQLVEEMLRKGPLGRPSMAQVAERLESMTRLKPAPPGPAVRTVLTAPQRPPIGMTLLAGAVVAVAVCAGIAFGRWSGASAVPAPPQAIREAPVPAQRAPVAEVHPPPLADLTIHDPPVPPRVAPVADVTVSRPAPARDPSPASPASPHPVHRDGALGGEDPDEVKKKITAAISACDHGDPNTATSIFRHLKGDAQVKVKEACHACRILWNQKKRSFFFESE